MAIIKFYPVDNGDTTLIQVEQSNIQIDSNIRSNDDCYDVKNDLLSYMRVDKKGKYHLDLFVLTHPDQDHCRGVETNYYLGDPQNYSSKDYEDELIIIDELMVTPMLFAEATSSDAKALKKEAERRRKLWEKDSSEKNKEGNRIVIIGYDGEKKFESLPSYVPGETIKIINNKAMSIFELFVHSPFKDSLVAGKAEQDKNATSIVMQARFKYQVSDESPVGLYLFGGDADHYIWEEIQNQCGNHDNAEKLDFDLFLAPHHCSWSYFNNVPYDDDGNDEPLASAQELISKHKTVGAFVIASSKEIKNDADNPPHYPAMLEYKKLIGSDNFISLAQEPSVDSPKPVVFELTTNGFQRKDQNNQKGSSGASISTSGCTGRKSTYGCI